ncbi:MAG: bifunctional tetrahydrofolate synthase/dihydrofolate synthase [Leucothrix sp.]
MSRTLSEWLAWQESLHLSSIDLGLDRVSRVANAMSLTSLSMPVITVAGTNGKGSSIAILDSVYKAAGYNTGCYTSPHLVRYNERIVLGGAQADDNDLCEAFTAIDAARGDISLTYFEFGTLAAAYLFQKHAVDIALFEVGLGGRLDAVNLWDADIALITNIDVDHIDWLGDDREQIGVEKAGIMRAGKTVVCGDTNPTDSMQSEATRIGAQLVQQGVDFSWQPLNDETWSYVDATQQTTTYPLPSLRGKFQLNNAAAAITVIKHFQDTLAVSDTHIAQGLKTAMVMGRLQKLADAPELLVDVAHNPQSADALAQYLKNAPSQGKTVALFSALADKDLQGIIKPVSPYFDEWHVVQLEGPRAYENKQLVDELKTLGLQTTIKSHTKFETALKSLQNELKSQDRVVAFGSFLVVSGVMQGLNSDINVQTNS